MKRPVQVSGNFRDDEGMGYPIMCKNFGGNTNGIPIEYRLNTGEEWQGISSFDRSTSVCQILVGTYYGKSDICTL